MSGKRVNVLFIASFAGCPRVWKMASVLAERDYDVSVLEWDRTASMGSFEKSNGVCVYRMKLRAPFGLKMVFGLPLWWGYVFLFLLSRRFVVVQPQNFDNLVPVWLGCRLKRTRIVYDVADFYASSSVFGGVVLFRKVLAWLERTFVKLLDAAIIADESRVGQVGLSGFPFYVIYNSPPDLYEQLGNGSVGEGSLSSGFTVFYAGILAKDRGLGGLVAAVQALDSVSLVVAGFGSMEKEFCELVVGKRNVRFLGRIPYDDVLKLTFSSDCVVALYEPSSPNNVFASPNKLFEAMMCKKPIIVNSGTAMAKKVKDENCGLIVNYGSTHELKKAISDLNSNPELSVTLGQNGRNAYVKKYNWSLMEERIVKLYSSFFQSGYRTVSR